MNPSAGSQSLANCVTTIRTCQIEDQSAQLAEAARANGDAIGQLANRLHRVVRANGPEGKCTDVPEEMLVPLASDIRDVRKQIQYATAIVTDLLQRLELP